MGGAGGNAEPRLGGGDREEAGVAEGRGWAELGGESWAWVGGLREGGGKGWTVSFLGMIGVPVFRGGERGGGRGLGGERGRGGGRG